MPKLDRTGRVVLVAAGLAATVSALVWIIQGRRDVKGLSAADSAACAHATAVVRVRDRTFVHLANFEITGAAALADPVATALLTPHYPTAVLPEKFGIEARRKLASPITLSAFNCEDATVVRLSSFTGTDTDVTIPRPASASVVRSVGSTDPILTWPPPIQAPPDPPKWLVTPFFYKPGLAVIRFTQHGKVIDRLTFLVCIPHSRQAAGKGTC